MNVGSGYLAKTRMAKWKECLVAHTKQQMSFCNAISARYEACGTSSGLAEMPNLFTTIWIARMDLGEVFQEQTLMKILCILGSVLDYLITCSERNKYVCH